MCLTDNNFRNLPTGDVVDKLIWEWGTYPEGGVTDSNGKFEVRLFHGDYKVTVTHPKMNGSSVVSQSFERKAHSPSYSRKFTESHHPICVGGVVVVVTRSCTAEKTDDRPKLFTFPAASLVLIDEES
ncbi:hypothetical protein Vadar_023036 [Vaccinium darrowii]|uniref:Uncharacterized protein n=1 Tax=Vaccinium darrowii TaxID=229202 RepID=A0ACB7X327_9ERIC|nr:hypothetical protein Vadar_023036 [Vaccinium darrowii]